MAFEQKDNSGALFKNERKEADTHADYNGTVRIDGHDYWINAWLKDGSKGKFFSLAFKRKDGTASRPASNDETKAYIESQKNKPHATQPALDDEIPF
jgi:hypothetical protein